MTEDEKKPHKRLLYSRLAIVPLLVAIFFVFKAVVVQYDKKQGTGESLEVALLEKERVDARARLLEEKLDQFGSERGIEMEIRNMFNVAKEGEKVIVVVNRENNKNEDSQPGGFDLWSWIKNTLGVD